MRWHAYACTGAAVAFIAAGLLLLSMQRNRLSQIDSDLKSAKSALQALRTTSAGAPTRSLFHAPSSAKAAQDLVADIGYWAKTLDWRLVSISVRKQEASAHELGRVQLEVTTSAGYDEVKLGLSGLLARYPSLALQSLSIQAATDGGRQHQVRMALILFLKD